MGECGKKDTSRSGQVLIGKVSIRMKEAAPNLFFATLSRLKVSSHSSWSDSDTKEHKETQAPPGFAASMSEMMVR